MTKRIFFTIILLGAVMFTPWWFVLALSLFGVFYFSTYYEIIAIGILVDLLYGIGGGIFSGYGLLGFTSAVVICFSFERIKREIRPYVL